MSSALLLPRSAVPESRLVTGAAGTALRAAAHVDFKIIIPPVLYVDVTDGVARIISNGRNVTLRAGIRPFDDARGNLLIMTATAHKIIEQRAACTPSAADPTPKYVRTGVTESTRRFCTVSMP